MKLGIFDSGIGGQAIANSLQASFPDAQILSVNDHKNIPYGDKTKAKVTKLTDKAIQPLLNSNCDIVVIACNTATALAIDFLRKKYPKQKFIGIEPMIKSASSLTKTKIITVCATPATLKSANYKKLVKKYGSGIKIIKPNCKKWAKMIEDKKINKKIIAKTIVKSIELGSDIIVLGCTHYHWIKGLIVNICDGRAQVLEPSEAMSRRVKKLLKLS